jgi:hypothetical protein
MDIRNEDVESVVVEAPGGHRHVRTRVRLRDGTELTFQEATVSNIVRAFVTVKTHPERDKVVLRGSEAGKRKRGYAKWQLLEVQDEEL